MGSVAEASEALDAGRVAEGKQILETLLQQQAGVYVWSLTVDKDDEALLAEQEKALLRLGQLHRDQQCVQTIDRQGCTEFGQDRGRFAPIYGLDCQGKDSEARAHSDRLL